MSSLVKRKTDTKCWCNSSGQAESQEKRKRWRFGSDPIFSQNELLVIQKWAPYIYSSLRPPPLRPVPSKGWACIIVRPCSVQQVTIKIFTYCSKKYNMSFEQSSQLNHDLLHEILDCIIVFIAGMFFLWSIALHWNQEPSDELMSPHSYLLVWHGDER